MVDRVNGKPETGVWFERDTTLVKLTSDAADFTEANFGVVGGLVDKVIRVIQTRGTVIGLAREDDNSVSVIIGHAGAVAGTEAELKAELDGLGGGAFTVLVGTKFIVA